MLEQFENCQWHGASTLLIFNGHAVQTSRSRDNGGRIENIISITSTV